MIAADHTESDLERWSDLGRVLAARSPEVLQQAIALLESFAVARADHDAQPAEIGGASC